MTVRRAIATVALSTLILASIGGGVGYALGTFAPNYYRQVFSNGDRPDFDPVSIGIGQGVTQGTAGGVVVGLVLVMLLVWRDVRAQAATAPEGAVVTTRSRSVARRLLFVCIGVIAVAVSAFGGFVVGLGGGVNSEQRHRFLEERYALEPYLDDEPAFADIVYEERSDGGVVLSGDVPTEADLARLRDVVIRVIGEERAQEAMLPVNVR